MIDPTINFPASIDTWPVLRDYGSSLQPSSYTLDSSHYNKLVNFVRKVQPLVSRAGAGSSGDGSLSSLGYSFIFRVGFRNLCLNSCAIPGQVGKMGFTNILPFQFVITDRPFDFSQLPIPAGYSGIGARVFLGIHQTTSGSLNSLIGSQNNPANRPLVTTTINNRDQIRLSNFMESRLLVTNNSVLGQNLLLINGLVINTALPDPSTFHSPTSPYPDLFSIWPNCEELELVVGVTGVN